MKTHTIHVERVLRAPQQTVWALLDDVTTWSVWGQFDAAALEAPGDAHGRGAVRVFRTGRRTTREVITRCEEPHTLAYDLLDGIPVKDYSAVVRLQPTAEGTSVSWSSSFRAAIPGTGSSIRRQLERFIAGMLADLARAVEQDVRTERSSSVAD